jgi:hypothetical protein
MAEDRPPEQTAAKIEKIAGNIDALNKIDQVSLNIDHAF